MCKAILPATPGVIVLAAVMAACGPLDPEASARMADGAMGSARPSSSAIVQPAQVDAALKNPRRRPADRAQDDRRQAAAVLDYFGIETGMVVLDLYSGGGYYAELLAYLVGPSGRVVAHNNTPYLTFAKDELADRYREGRLPNVEQLIAENNELELPEQRFDAVVMIKAYHDVYYVDEEAGWEPIDRIDFLVEVYDSMKPGGVLGIVDHVAAPGSPATTGGTLHRIDPELIRRDMDQAGFIYEGESGILRNKQDDYSVTVFDEKVRNRTDKVVMRFRKPARGEGTE
ncbi:MAG: class I SAM-dependent methyltransferase [Gammaproteobacteria bacterium]